MSARGRGLAARAVLACAALLVAVAAGAKTDGKKAGRKESGRKESGGAMNVTVTMLDAVKPGRLIKDPVSMDDDKIESIPLVLWAPSGPWAALAYHWQTLRSRNELLREFLPLSGGGQGAFPLRFHAKALRDLVRNEDLNLIRTERIVMADVDGDGAEELVLPRDQGGIEVWSPKRRVFDYPTPTSHPRRVIYYADSWYRATLPGREELFLLMARNELETIGEEQLAAMGVGEKQRLLRIGQAGISRIVLKGLPPRLKNVRAVIPVNLPGSRDVDELVVFSEHDELVERRLYEYMSVSRHRLDGTVIEPPRRAYWDFDPSKADLKGLIHSPQSDQILVVSKGNYTERYNRLYFIMPRKPADWIRAVDLSFLPMGEIEALGMTRGPSPLAIFRYRDPPGIDELYAVNEDRQFFVRRGGAWVPTGKPVLPGGEWEPGSKPQPFYRIKPPREGFEQHAYEVYPLAPGADPDELVVVYSRERDARPLTHEELLAAGKRFLSAERLAKLEAEVPPRLDNRSLLRDEAMEKERSERGFTGEIKTVEDWKKHLPRSYAEVEAHRRESYFGSLKVELLWILDHPGDLQDYREPDAHVAWARSVERPAATSFTVVRQGAVVASFEVPGFCSAARSTELNQPQVSLRMRDGILTAIAALSQVPGQEEERFYLIRALPRGR